jgi:EAL domain-containing protein (putative c-di-GMP-specific phosphodiesterase class I)
MKFQPIVHTSRRRIVGYECMSDPSDFGNPEGSPAWQAADGLYFLNAPRSSVTRCLSRLGAENGLARERVVFQVDEGDAGVVDAIRKSGAALALRSACAMPGFFDAVRAFNPEYVKLDAFLTKNAAQPASAFTIRKAVEWGDRFGFRVIATAVDRHHTVEHLWLLGVEIMQGDLMGPPAPGTLRMKLPLNRFALKSSIAGSPAQSARLQLT